MDDAETSLSDDDVILRRTLSHIQEGARSLRWADERPWRVDGHIWLEHDLPVIDLHDLNVRLAREAVRAAAAAADQLRCGALCFVTGRGRHSMGPPALRGMVAAELRRACKKNPSWDQRAGHAGRWMLITDPSRAPRVATGQLGLVFWLGVVLFSALAIWALVGLPS